MINVKMQQSETVNSLSPKITVIGVGGAGGNAVNNMIASNLEGCEFLVCNTDAQALEHSLCENKIQLGTNVTGGLGAGSKPEVGQAAAEESLEEVLEYLDGANMAFVTAGMGGGTGTGAAPVIAKACRERGILTVGVVTKPFHFEGSHRMKMAEAGLKEMQNYVDTLIVIPNQNLFRVANEKTTFADGFKMADSVLQSGVRGVTDLMVRPGLVNLDFADIRTAMLEMGKAMMGTGEATGEKRAIEAAEAAINNPLLDDVTMKGARGVIINVTGGMDMTLFEADEACNRIRDEVDPNANIIFGATFDEKMEGTMRVSIVATGIEREADSRMGGGSGKTMLERATPMHDGDAPSEDKAPEDMGSSAPARTYKTGVDNLRGITAPVKPAATTAPRPSETPAPAAPEEASSDLFEGTKASMPAPEAAPATSAAPSKPVRGTRYKDAFIPPQPVMVEGKEHAPLTMPNAQTPMVPPMQKHMAEAPAAAAAPSSPTPSSMAAPQKAPGLVLNPPRKSAAGQAAAGAMSKTQSFFERLAGSVQERLTGASHEDAAHNEQQHMPRRTMSSPSLGSSSPAPTKTAVGAPAQGQLNIDAPAAPPAPRNEDDLDIPAFLRRQAN
ncbi:MAG: cell division protein FtsZ [Alphaproteobacteria bacterium]|nr:cell division protein FtsZ [Alphaproteobacteria bacterium]